MSHSQPTDQEKAVHGSSGADIAQVDLSKYTLDTYMRIVTFKTAFYSFYLPVACGLLVRYVT